MTGKARRHFWTKVRQTAACWVWQGARDPDGYGRFGVRGLVMFAHRVSWEIWNEKSADGLLVLHSCDNPICVRPSHLRVGTSKENAADMHSRGRAKPPTGEKHPSAKLTAADVLQMRTERAMGKVSYRDLARRLDVSATTARAAVLGQTWKGKR